jgi:hypothetical protein
MESRTLTLNNQLQSLREKLTEQGVKYCIGAYVDLHGVPKGKVVPIEHFAHFAHDYGCCFVLTLHPWLSGRPSRVRLIERLVRSIQEKEQVWFSRGQGIASYFRANPDARHEVDFDPLLSKIMVSQQSSLGLEPLRGRIDSVAAKKPPWV